MATTGFPRQFRLIEPKEYDVVFSRGQRLASGNLVLLYRGNGLNYGRLGLAVTKKHTKHAVQRNFVKRLIREQFRLNQDIFAGVDVVVLSRPCLVSMNREQICAQLNTLWENYRRRCAG